MFTTEERQEIELYFAYLYGWSEEEAQLYKSITWTFKGKQGETLFANYAAQSLDGLMRLVETRARRKDANIYACLGTQRMADMATTSNDGYPKAKRIIANMVSYRSVALDIDVGKPGTYATTEDAFTALDAFTKAAGLPPPSMEVYSGSGGIHIYWCMTEAVPLANWQPMAKALRDAALNFGLKFDPQCTVNAAGILRVPNTFNHKSTPPSRVSLYREERHTFPRYSYQQLSAVLAQWVTQPGKASVHAAATEQMKSEVNKNFAAGVDEATAPPVNIDDVAVNCPAIDDMLSRGGNGDAEPLWNLGLMAASFTTDPFDAAHRLSDQDPRYVAVATEKKLREKVNARLANPNIGWPTCDSFSKLHPACSTCPLFAFNKTPFHHARRPQFTPPPVDMNGDDAQVNANDPIMPFGYWRNKDNHIYTILRRKDGEQIRVPVVRYPILDAGYVVEDGSVNYKAMIGGQEVWRNVNVTSSMQPVAAAQAFARGNGIFVDPKNFDIVRNFLMAWTTHLQSVGKHSRQSSYGWGDNRTTFGFDDKLYYENKVETVYRGKNHDPNFTVKGKVKPWQDAMALVYGNPALECIVASAFAAPLVELVGTTSVVLSAYSKNSGVGKSTAMALGQAVWGHPRGGMSTLNDTTNSMMKKITDLKSLPLYWDELRTKGQLEKVIDIIFSVTQGKGKARLTKEIVQAEASPFTTMFIVASNYGLADTVYNQTESTDAGGLRLFEIEPRPLTTNITTYAANQLLLKVQDNYGVIGAAYAEWLAASRKDVEALLKAVSDDFNTEHTFEPRERFWALTMATLYVGATLSNACGFTRFDLPALRTFLGDALSRQRKMMHTQDFSTLATAVDAAAILSELRMEQHNRSLICTATIPYPGAGRPVQVQTEDTDMSKVSNVWAQYGVKDGRMRMLVRPFNEWLRKRGLNPGQFKEMLKGHYIVTQSKQSIGAGVLGFDAVATRAECLDLTPIPHAPSHGSDEQT
jgi:Domain of unknown function (DUF927)